MKKNESFLSVLAGVLLFTVLFVFTDVFTEGIGSGLSVCGKILIPSLFPFLIAASLTGSTPLPIPVKKALNPITRFLFGLPSDCLPAIILGQLGGYLSGAKSVQSLCSGGIISPSQAERILLFCINAGMGFSVNAVGSGMLNSREAGKVLLFSLCISSVVLGVVARFFIKDKSDSVQKQKIESIPFSSAVVSSVTSGTQSMLAACGFVIIFSGIGAVIESIAQSHTLRLILNCLLEVTKGCRELSGNASLPVIAAVCAFGGLCVHLQIFAICREIPLNLLRFYLFRLLHSVTAYAVCKIILHFHPVTLTASVSFYSNARVFSFSAPAAISLLFLCALLILDLDNNRKIC